MDKKIKQLLIKLNDNNYEAYIVGGYVRYFLLNKITQDIDICTNAKQEYIIKLLELHNYKVNYGSINFIYGKYNIDITTYRIERVYQNRRPIKIEYTNNILDDLSRRDFTINSLLMDKDEVIIDKYNGREDLNNKVIRCIGNLKQKMEEDPLRILRAVRFATINKFIIEDTLFNYIKINKYLINNLSEERKLDELNKILLSDNVIYGLELIEKLGLKQVLNINYNLNKVMKYNDLLLMYVQINLLDGYNLPRNIKNSIIIIKKIIKSGVNNNTLFNFGLFNNIHAGLLLNIDKKVIIRKYNSLPIKSKKDIKICVEDIVKIKKIGYNEVNQVYTILINNILNNIVKNNNREIVRFLKEN